MDGDLIPAGVLITEPSAKIVFNALYDEKHIYHIKLLNPGARRIGWTTMTTNNERIFVDPPYGVVVPNEPILIAVSCDAFAVDREDTNDDHITIAWVNTFEEYNATFGGHREWFQADGMIRRRNLPIEYNP